MNGAAEDALVGADCPVMEEAYTDAAARARSGVRRGGRAAE